VTGNIADTMHNFSQCTLQFKVCPTAVDSAAPRVPTWDLRDC
jgi:hypothetical protein